ncbi:Lysylphosphatidylglycerol synthetase, C-terminal domain, DUF2156 family [Actinomyces ruminicola]|uniref:Lysylphosphatidylglycerol synthetase, C-terminal domain, DUF2156 family n=1 Tax=Actinomyces ruminicola TaxID=332524 RepID=A0A1H0CNL2_9ACTO|nr:Lysylphosphatidylglycerol synthetase, C-terminal domain, DUF2156 family [Actinomyces ruminicola]
MSAPAVSPPLPSIAATPSPSTPLGTPTPALRPAWAPLPAPSAGPTASPALPPALTSTTPLPKPSQPTAHPSRWSRPRRAARYRTIGLTLLGTVAGLLAVVGTLLWAAGAQHSARVIAPLLLGFSLLAVWHRARLTRLARLTAAGARQKELGALVRAHGAGTLGWMLTWRGNQAWINPDGDAGFAYRVGGGVALTLGDPAATPAGVEGAVDEFSAFAADAGLIPALYSVHEPVMRAARARGWTVLQVAEEAVIDLEGLAFRGKAFQDVRTALNHARREGISARWTTWETAPAGWRDQIRAISQEWAHDQVLPEMGFTLGGLPELDDADTRLLLAVDSEGTVHAVTSWLPVHREDEVIGLTLDVMRRRKGGWRPAIEYLIARAVQDAQAEGLELLSLSGAPLARSADVPCPGAAAARLDPVLDRLARLLEPAYGFASLHSFKRKFQPRAVPMYLAVPEAIDLPAVGLAIARAYLPGLSPVQAARFARALVSHE